MRRSAIVALGLAAALAGTLWLIGESAPRRDGPRDTEVIVAAQGLIRDHLKAPATADFGYPAVRAQPRLGRVWAVVGQVDAENAFGALLRHDYVAAVEALCDDYGDPRCWRLLRLVIGDQVLVGAPPAGG